MKVLIVRNAFSYDFGGAERLAVHYAEDLQCNSIKTTVVSCQPRLLAYAQAAGVPNHKGLWWSQQKWSGLRALGFPIYLLWQCVLIAWYVQLLLRIKPDVLHLMSKDDFIAGTLAGRLLGKSIVWTDPADLKHIFRNHAVWYKNPVGKLVYLVSHLAGAIALVSDSERRLITESVGHRLPNNFIVMHIAGRDETVTPRPRDKQDQHAVVFCATSRLVEAKGISDLVQAFNELSKHTDDYRLWLVGDGPDEKRFRAKAKDNQHIVFVGHTETPLTYVAASDVFVHPSHHEGFSLSLAEAAMLGKPMIATNVGGNPELVNEANGTLVPAKDPAAFCAAMKRLGSNAALRKKLGLQARHDYTTKFDFSTIVKERLIPLYEKVRV